MRRLTSCLSMAILLLAACGDEDGATDAGSGDVGADASGTGDVAADEGLLPPFEPIRHDDRLTLWTEFFTVPELIGHMPFVATGQANLNVAVYQGVTSRDDLAAICSAAAEHDVALRLWPLIDMEQGYWPNQDNYTPYLMYVDELMEMAREVCPRVDGLVVDMEMGYDRTKHLEELLEKEGGLEEALEYMLDGIDEATFEEAREAYHRAVLRYQAMGYRVTVTTWPWVVDDLADGDETLAMALGTPVLEIPWDAVSFMVYRTVYDTQFSAMLPNAEEPFTSGLITSYGESIVAAFGDRAAIDVGTTSTSGVATHGGLGSAAELHSDVGAALAAGIPVGRIAVYNLEGILEYPDAAEWVTVPAPLAAPVDDQTTSVRAVIGMLDGLHP